MKKNYYFGIIIPLFLISLNASSQATTKIQQRLDYSLVADTVKAKDIKDEEGY